MKGNLKIHDTVVLVEPVGQFVAGQVGVIVERWNDSNFEVEFVDAQANTIGFSVVPENALLKLYFNPKAA